MAVINKAQLLGNMGADPVLRYTPGGEAVVVISLATTEVWRDKNKEKRERTEWHRVVFWGKLALAVSDHLKKGSQLYVEGRLRTRKWEKDGVTRYATEIVASDLQMLGHKDFRGVPDVPSDEGMPEPENFEEGGPGYTVEHLDRYPD